MRACSYIHIQCIFWIRIKPFTKSTKLHMELFKSFWNIQSTSLFCKKKSYNYFPTRSSLLAFSKELNHPTFVKDFVIIFLKKVLSLSSTRNSVAIFPQEPHSPPFSLKKSIPLRFVYGII